jgi:hypothetical protein
MIAGDTLGVTWDNVVNLNANHLGTLLNQKGLSWKVYSENLPSPCYLGKSSGLYARKHVPFLSFVNVQKSSSECAKIVEASEFLRDVSSNTLPAYSMYIPNLANDGHNTNPSFSARWFESTFGPILKNQNLMKDTLIIATFDEAEGVVLTHNKIYTAMIGANVIPGSVVSSAANHYSILRMIEDNFGLGNLGKKDKSANEITGIWK